MGARDYAHGHHDSFVEVAERRKEYAGQTRAFHSFDYGRVLLVNKVYHITSLCHVILCYAVL